jgi:hypothetical protein
MKKLVVDTLKQLDLYSEDACNLVRGTIAQESTNGKFRRQIGGGPGLGIAQIEPATFYDCITNYLDYRKPLKAKIMAVCGVTSLDHRDLEFNDKLSIAICRIKYLRVGEKIPSTVEGYAAYWKEHYNTEKGKGRALDFIMNYRFYVEKEALM